MSAADALVDCQAENAAMRKRIAELERLNAVALEALEQAVETLYQFDIYGHSDALNNAITELNKEKEKRT